MMNKVSKTLLFLLMLLVCTVSFVSCDLFEDDDVQKNKFYPKKEEIEVKYTGNSTKNYSVVTTCSIPMNKYTDENNYTEIYNATKTESDATISVYDEWTYSFISDFKRSYEEKYIIRNNGEIQVSDSYYDTGTIELDEDTNLTKKDDWSSYYVNSDGSQGAFAEGSIYTYTITKKGSENNLDVYSRSLPDKFPETYYLNSNKRVQKVRYCLYDESGNPDEYVEKEYCFLKPAFATNEISFWSKSRFFSDENFENETYYQKFSYEVLEDRPSLYKIRITRTEYDKSDDSVYWTTTGVYEYAPVK